ncbi:effector-associated constant component EACC1 [Streptomyces europaeiscabiei]|uniref:effector-associated constant component EACC1 n=1 Tax=Streptomyces europaeiscabiei TaxID=146819 RepID=UPI0038D3E4BA
MQVTLQVAGDLAEEETRSLYDWLLLDRVVRREARVEMGSSSAPVPGQQGAVLDLVSLVLSTGISAASLGVSIASWRATRPQEPTVTVERFDGSKVTITGTSREEAQRLVEQLLGERQ